MINSNAVQPEPLGAATNAQTKNLLQSPGSQFSNANSSAFIVGSEMMDRITLFFLSHN